MPAAAVAVVPAHLSNQTPPSKLHEAVLASAQLGIRAECLAERPERRSKDAAGRTPSGAGAALSTSSVLKPDVPVDTQAADPASSASAVPQLRSEPLCLNNTLGVWPERRHVPVTSRPQPLGLQHGDLGAHAAAQRMVSKYSSEQSPMWLRTRAVLQGGAAVWTDMLAATLLQDGSSARRQPSGPDADLQPVIASAVEHLLNELGAAKQALSSPTSRGCLPDGPWPFEVTQGSKLQFGSMRAADQRMKLNLDECAVLGYLVQQRQVGAS
jgi:hypothetical protein